jgi:hypothetical protein
MDAINTVLQNIDFIGWVWIFVIAFALHELEEWNILRWYERNYTDLPASTNKSIRVWIGFVILISIFWGVIATLPGNTRIAIYFFLPAVFIAVQNALQHVYWQFYFKQYAPGIITAVCLLIPLGIYLISQAVWQYAIPLWYPGILLLLIIPGLIQTYQAKNRMTKPIRAIHFLGIKLIELLNV